MIKYNKNIVKKSNNDNMSYKRSKLPKNWKGELTHSYLN